MPKNQLFALYRLHRVIIRHPPILECHRSNSNYSHNHKSNQINPPIHQFLLIFNSTLFCCFEMCGVFVCFVYYFVYSTCFVRMFVAEYHFAVCPAFDYCFCVCDLFFLCFFGVFAMVCEECAHYVEQFAGAKRREKHRRT